MPESREPIVTFDDFLSASVHRMWVSESPSFIDLLAVLLAVPEAWQVAWDETTKDGYAKVAVAGALSVATLTGLLRLILAGPLGLSLTGLSVGTLATIYAANQSRILERTREIAAVVESYRGEFGGLVELRNGKPMRAAQWSVMMDGLVARFLAEISSSHRFDPASVGGFAEHVVGPSMRPPTKA